MSARNARGISQQQMINKWFKLFVAGLAYEQCEYHQFCEDVKGKSNREIEAYYNTLV